MSKNEFEFQLMQNINQLRTIRDSLKCYQAHLVQVNYDEMILQLDEIICDLHEFKIYEPLFMKHAKSDKTTFIDDEIDLEDF